MRFRMLAALVAVALLVALPVVAQEQRGSIDGVVKDAQGGAIVGATVVAKSMAGATRRGRHRRHRKVPLPLPRTGPLGSHRQPVRLRSGQGPERGPAPRPAAHHHPHPQPRRDDRDRAGRGRVPAHRRSRRARAPPALRAEDIDKMPKGRDFTSLVTQAPGANLENAKLGGISIDGASARREPLHHRRRRDHQPAERRLGQGHGHRLRGRGPGQVLRLHRRVRRRHRRRHQRRSPAPGRTRGAATPFTYYRATASTRATGPASASCPTNSNAAEYVTYAEDEYSRVGAGLHRSAARS